MGSDEDTCLTCGGKEPGKAGNKCVVARWGRLPILGHGGLVLSRQNEVGSFHPHDRFNQDMDPVLQKSSAPDSMLRRRSDPGTG